MSSGLVDGACVSEPNREVAHAVAFKKERKKKKKKEKKKKRKKKKRGAKWVPPETDAKIVFYIRTVQRNRNEIRTKKNSDFESPTKKRKK